MKCVWTWLTLGSSLGVKYDATNLRLRTQTKTNHGLDYSHMNLPRYHTSRAYMSTTAVGPLITSTRRSAMQRLRNRKLMKVCMERQRSTTNVTATLPRSPTTKTTMYRLVHIPSKYSGGSGTRIASSWDLFLPKCSSHSAKLMLGRLAISTSMAWKTEEKLLPVGSGMVKVGLVIPQREKKYGEFFLITPLQCLVFLFNDVGTVLRMLTISSSKMLSEWLQQKALRPDICRHLNRAFMAFLRWRGTSPRARLVNYAALTKQSKIAVKNAKVENRSTLLWLWNGGGEITVPYIKGPFSRQAHIRANHNSLQVKILICG